MSRRLIAASALIIMLSLLVVAHTSSGFKPEGQPGPVLGKPLSGIEERHNETILNDGTRSDQPSSGLFYRDEQGRMRVESQTKVVIYDPTIRLIYIADLRTKTYKKMQVHPASPVSIVVVEDGIWIAVEAPPRPAPAPGAAPASPAPASAVPTSATSKEGPKEAVDTRTSREDLPPAVIAGVHVKGTRTTSIIPAGTVGNDHDLKAVSERWYSDDIKALLKSSSSDPRYGSLKYELTNISQAPPDPSLFQLPAGMTLLTDEKK